jgi:hypothetical protein
MRNVCAVAVLCAAVAAVVACESPVSAVRELDKKNVKTVLRDHGADFSTEIKSIEDLEKSKLFEDDASRDAIKKHVDLGKQKVVVVVWWGSSSSWVTTTVSKDGKKVSFNIEMSNPAFADMRPHVHLFAVPKDMVVETPLDKLKCLPDEQKAKVVNCR